MPSDQPMEYLDANVLLAYISGEADRVDIVEQLLSEAAEGKRTLVTSTLSIVEVAYAVSDLGIDLSEESEQAIDELWAPPSPILLIEPSVAVMRRARGFLRQAKSAGRKLKPADSIHLASAAMTAAVGTLLTYETENTRTYWAEVTALVVAEPDIDQRRLPWA
ncbi:MAG: type II toxin-antitoxin system VapC family toxin [Acidimicrobiia bacterium]|nr:type II toxin-antitoxin system VapC family toxin [Acidimicrobiia bacterium]